LRSMSAISVLLIDSSVPGSPHGELDASTLTWLDSTLASEKMHPAFLFLHHPPFSTGIGHMDLQNLRNADDLAAILRRHARVRLIAAGMSTAHTHNIRGNSGGDLPRTQSCRRSRSRRSISPILQNRVARVSSACLVSRGYGDVVTHFVPLGNFEGPYPFLE